jgi:hypothetical protein
MGFGELHRSWVSDGGAVSYGRRVSSHTVPPALEDMNFPGNAGWRL